MVLDESIRSAKPSSFFFLLSTCVLQGRKKAMKVLRTMMRERMAHPGRQNEDFFDVLIEELRRDKPVMTEAIALDLMFVLLFASFETTALALTLGVKLLAQNPRVLRALTVSILRVRAVLAAAAAGGA
jgi:cytochrome P450